MPSDRILPAIGLRLLSVALFSAMNACIKLAEAGGAALGELLFFRQAGAAVFVIAVIVAGPGLGVIRTTRLPAHLLRAAIGLVSMAFVFTGVTMLPLAEATTIGFTVPIFATVLGALVLREPTGWHRWAAVVIGFAGVVLVAQPGAAAFPLWGAAAALVGASLTAVISILLRQLGRTEAPLTTVFWFSALSCLPLGLVYVFVAQGHAPLTWAWLVLVGLLGGAAQVAMTGSLRLGPVSVVVPMDYASLLWATFYGWLLFGALPAAATWIGAPVIVGSGLYIVWREHLRRREETDRAQPAA